MTFNCGEPKLRFRIEKDNKCSDEYILFTEVRSNQNLSLSSNHRLKVCGNEKYPALFINPERSHQLKMEFVTRNEPLSRGSSKGFACRFWCFKSVEELKWINANPEANVTKDGRLIPHRANVGNKDQAFVLFESQNSISTYNDSRIMLRSEEIRAAVKIPELGG